MSLAAAPAFGAAAGMMAVPGATSRGESALQRAPLGVTDRFFGAIKGAVVLGWYFWTLPFRIGCSMALVFFLRVVAQPLDFAQDQVLGFQVLGVEKTTNKFVAIIKPLWRKVFPFKDQDIDIIDRPDAVQNNLGQHQFQQNSFKQQQQQQQQNFTGTQRVAGAAPAYAPSSRYSEAFDMDEDDFQRPREAVPTQRDSEYGRQRPVETEGRRRSEGSSYEYDRGRNTSSTRRRRPDVPLHSRSSSLSDDVSDDMNSDESEASVKLPPAAVHASAAEIDKAVLLAIEAQQTHVVVEKLFWVAVLLMAIVGVVLFRIDFTRNWSGQKIADVEPAMGFEGIYGVLLVLTMAFRSDFPFNLGILMLVVFYAGVVFGTIISRNAFAKPLAQQD